MNELNATNLSQVVAWVLNDAAQAVKSGGQFVVEQAPDVARQYVTYHMIMGWFCVGLIPLALVLIRHVLEWAAKRDKEARFDDMAISVYVATSILTFFMMFAGLVNFQQTMKATFAPKVLILEASLEVAKTGRLP